MPLPGRRGPRDPQLIWRPVGEKMLGWEHVPERLDPQAPGWAVQENENENDTQLCPEGQVRSIYCSLLLVSDSLSHANLAIKWEVYFFKEVFARLLIIASKYVFYMYICIVVAYDYTVHNTVKAIKNICSEAEPQTIEAFSVSSTQNVSGPVNWGCRKHRLHLCLGVRLPLTNVCPRY